MPIQNENPLILPAESEKTFPQIWVSSLNVTVPSASEGSLHLQLRPCDSSTGEIADDQYSKSLAVNFWGLVSEVPEAATAMQAVFDAIPAIEAYYEASISSPPYGGEENMPA